LHTSVRHTNYDELAETYDRRYDADDYTGIERALSEFVGPRRQRVLEIGCGTGHWLRQLQHLNVSAMGVDPSWPMLSRARAKLGPGRLIRACAENLPFANGRFDSTFSINAHHHFSDKHKAIEETRRVLRPGGALMMIALDPHAGADQWWVYDYFAGTLEIDKQRYPSCEQLRGWMRSAGFVDTRTCEVQHLPGDVSARDALETEIVDPGHTSQLAVLTADEFAAGVARIRAALVRDPRLRLSADLRVYGTFGIAG
jgi:SAM-dependent methyltransferase